MHDMFLFHDYWLTSWQAILFCRIDGSTTIQFGITGIHRTSDTDTQGNNEIPSTDAHICNNNMNKITSVPTVLVRTLDACNKPHMFLTYTHKLNYTVKFHKAQFSRHTSTHAHWFIKLLSNRNLKNTSTPPDSYDCCFHLTFLNEIWVPA